MISNKAHLDKLKGELNFYKKKLEEIKNTFKNKTQKDADNILISLSNILQEAGDAYTKLESASEKEWDFLKKEASVAFKDLKKVYNDALKNSSAQVQVYVESIEDQYHETLDSAEEYIKKNPIKSVLYAVGLGYFVGRFLK